MPATTSTFNVGRDYSFTIVIAGQTFAITNSLITDVARKPVPNLHEVVPLNNDGKPVFRVTFAGYDVTLHFTRQDGTFDLLVDALEQNYYQGSTPPVVTMMETMRNPNGSVDQFQYLGGAIVPEDLGTFKGADPVNDVTLRIRFSERNPVGGAVTSITSLATATSFL